MATVGFVVRPARLGETAIEVDRQAVVLVEMRRAVDALRPGAAAFGTVPESGAALAAARDAKDSVVGLLGTVAADTQRLAESVTRCATGYQRTDDDVADGYKSLLPPDGPTTGGGSAPDHAPLLPTGIERRDAIINGRPGRIVVDPGRGAQAYPHPWYALESLEEVTANQDLIEGAARRHGLDPDLVKAVVWMESTHGQYDRLWPGKTVRPMNVHAQFWADLVAQPDLSDPAINIETGAYILRGIQDRVVDPTPEKVLTLYNNLRADNVTGYGLTAAHYYRSKPWEK